MLARELTLAAVLLLHVQSLRALSLPAAFSYEFTAYRMQQYSLGMQKHGCAGAIVVAEARYADEPVLTRRCVVMKVPDFTMQRYLEAQKQNAAAILILLPQNSSTIAHDAVQSEVLLRGALLPVYAVPEDDQLLCMYEEVKQAAASRTSSIFFRVLRSMVTATGFQILVSNSSPVTPNTDIAVVTLEGVLPGAGEAPPTIVITAHYDSYGLAPWLAHGSDSNGSGVVILLELARLFQKLYSSRSTRPAYHLMFALTGGGKYNFLGTRRWIEENLDHAESSLLHDSVELVLCLDTLANGDELYVHVSHPPKPKTPMHSFIHRLEEVVSSRFSWVKLGMVHKKISLLAESSVAWEHERFAMRSILGFTLSHLEDPRSGLRGSILDKMAAQLMDKGPSQMLLVNTLEQEFRQHLVQVHRHTFRQDKRDPDITFFDQMSQPMVMYRVKPAASDLFLGGCIAGYLGIVYYTIQTFGGLYKKLATVKSKHR